MIQLRHLTRRFGPVTAVRDVSLDIAQAASVAILGPSGSGKTTLLRLIAGLEMPDEGEIRIGGRLASRPGWLLPPHQRGIGFVFQAPALWPHMTVAQNVLFGLQQVPRPHAQARLAEILEQTALSTLAARFPAQLSGGEARRVSLARALAPRPKYLLMDEPLTNLDLALKAELLSLVQHTARATGAALVYVTHDPDEAAQISGRILTLRDGRLATEPGGAGPSEVGA